MKITLSSMACSMSDCSSGKAKAKGSSVWAGSVLCYNLGYWLSAIGYRLLMLGFCMLH
jgi:hypothetical protein